MVHVEAVREAVVLVVEAVHRHVETPREQQQDVRRERGRHDTPAWRSGDEQPDVGRSDEEQSFVLGQKRSGEGQCGDGERPGFSRQQPAARGGQGDGERERQRHVCVGGQELVEDRRREREGDQRRP